MLIYITFNLLENGWKSEHFNGRYRLLAKWLCRVNVWPLSRWDPFVVFFRVFESQRKHRFESSRENRGLSIQPAPPKGKCILVIEHNKQMLTVARDLWYLQDEKYGNDHTIPASRQKSSSHDCKPISEKVSERKDPVVTHLWLYPLALE